jgi:methyl-accepting chemotaxis protein
MNESGSVCVEEADKAKYALEDIMQKIKEITNMNSQIATTAEEQSAVGHTMNENLSEIGGLVSNNAISADTVLIKNQELNQSLNTLNSLVKNFKLK